jgi:hypothetical protein
MAFKSTKISRARAVLTDGAMGNVNTVTLKVSKQFSGGSEIHTS